MANGFKWSLDWDTNPLRKGGEQAATALESTIGTFEELAREADTATGKAGDGLGGDVKEGGRTAKQALADLEGAFRETARKAQQSTRDTGKALSSDVHEGATKAREAVGEFKSEATQNFSEVASSFKGDMTSAVDLVQGTLGGLAGAVPGFGLALGGLGAVAGAVASQWQASSEQAKQAISDMYDDMLASGQSYLSAEFQQAQISKILKGEAGAITDLSDAQDLAKRSGQELSTVLAALAGDGSEQGRVTESLSEKVAGYQRAIDDARASGTLTQAMYDSYEAKINDVRRDQGHWNDLLSTTNGSLDAAQAKVSASRDAMDKLVGAFDRTTDAAGRVSQGIAAMPTSATIKLDVDDSAVQAWARRPVVINAVARVGTPQPV